MAAGLEQANEQINAIQGNIDKVFDMIPGGGILQEALGLDGVADMLKGAVMNGIKAMTAGFMTANGPVYGLQAGMMAFNKTVMANPMMLVVAAAAGLTAILMLNNKKAKELAKETGLSKLQAKGLLANAKAAAGEMDTMYATASDIVDVQKEMIAEFGTTLMMTEKQAAATADIGMAFGYGADQAGAVNAQLMKMGASVEEANEIQVFTAALSEAAGVGAGAVMKDIAENSEDAAKYITGGAKAMANMAVEAAKMGTNLKGLTKMADNLLDVESSLEKTAIAQAMTGKMINFDKARQLALDGKLGEMGKEVLKQVGSLEEFNAMNVKQKEAMAEAAGMEVGELQATLALEKKRSEMTDDEIAKASKLGLTAAEINDMSADQIKHRVAQADAAERLGKQLDNIKSTFMTAIMPLAEAFGNAMTLVLPVVNLIGSAIQGFLLPFTTIFNVINKIVKKFKSFMEDIGLAGPMADIIKGTFKAIGVILGISILPSVYAWTASMITQATSTLPGMVKDFFKIAGTVVFEILPNILAWTASLIYQAITSIPSILGSLISIGSTLLFTILPNVLAWTASMIYQAITSIPAILTSMVSIGSTLLFTILPNVLAWTASMIAQAMTAIPAIVSGLGAAATAMIPLITGAISSAIGFLSSAVGAIFSTFAAIPFGLGIPLAIAAVAGLFALFSKAKAKKAGDVGIDPNGGPVVASPQEGGVFQGTKNDGVSMSPGHGVDGGGGGGEGGGGNYSKSDLEPILESLKMLIEAASNPPPVVIGEKESNQVGNIISAAKSMIG
jgi:hypothetical protein